MNYDNVTAEISYLGQFYTAAQLDNYANGNQDLIRALYKQVQPKKVKIGKLFGTILKNKTMLVSSPDGWVPVVDCIQKIKEDMYTVEFQSGIIINASHDHLFQKPDESWHYMRELLVGDMVLAKSGADTISRIEHYSKKTKVYDLSVNHRNHRYFTNSVCSHNSGKSLFMQNLAVNWAEMGKNGIFVTLELSEDLCAMRIDSMMTGTPSKTIFKNLDDVEMKVKMKAKSSGNLQIKYFPAQSTVNDIRAFVKELHVKQGNRIDFICIDYLDLLMPVTAKVGPSDLFVKDKYVSEEIRNLGKELDVVMVTASQLNRCLAINTRVIANGKKIEIKDVQVGDYLTSNAGDVEVYEVLPITKQSVYKIKTKSGKEIICSAKHKFPTTEGILTIENGLKPGNTLYSKPLGG